MSRTRTWIGDRVRARLDTLLDPRLELATATSAATKSGLRQLSFAYRSAVHDEKQLPTLRDVGFRIFSEVDEDGILLFLLAVVGVDRGRFVDIGAGDCLTASNCANLALNLGFHGLFVDANQAAIEAATRLYGSHRDTRTYPPKAVHAFVTRENVNDVIRGAGFEGPVDVLSIDVDGNDYWIWEAITCVQPRIVVIETHVEYGLDDTCAPYRADFNWRSHAKLYEVFGASPAAMQRLGRQLGYRLVGGNRYGFNAIFLREDLDADVIPTVGVEELLRHDRNIELGIKSESSHPESA